MQRTIIALALAMVALAGCGGDDNEQAATPAPKATQEPATSGAAGGGQSVKVSAPADGALKFDQAKLKANAGKVTFEFSNPSSVPHAFEVEGSGLEKATKVVTKGDASVTVDLKPGKYEYYCPVGNHKDAGMKGTLTVQ